MAMSSFLPAYGWTQHSEQTSVAALEAHTWGLNTTLIAGRVDTRLLSTPPPHIIAKLEATAKRRIEHQQRCRDPFCNERSIARLCPDGKFNHAGLVFYTSCVDVTGTQIVELCCLATTPEEAAKNHYATCTMLAGVLAAWSAVKDVPV